MDCPPEFRDLYVARATITGPLAMDIMKVREMLEMHRKALEEREDRAERALPGMIVPCWVIVGFYCSWDEAHAGLEWVRAWRSGS